MLCLAVFRVTNVLTLPSHYILKRKQETPRAMSFCKNILVMYILTTWNLIQLDIPLSDTRPLNLLIKVQASLKLLMLQRMLYKKLQKIAQVNRNEGRTPSNGKVRSHLLNDESIANYTSTCQDESLIEYMNKDDMDKHIAKLTDELKSANRKCEIYRSNLLSVLKAVENHKLELSVKLENIKIGMKEGL